MGFRLDSLWYRHLDAETLLKALPLLPLSAVYAAVSLAKKAAGAAGFINTYRAPVPVVVVGGVTVGGSGKTPVCGAILEDLAASGLRPGLLSRGYKGKASHYPLVVTDSTDAVECGDEPLLLKRRLGDRAEVVVDPNRARGAKFLAEERKVDVIVCDDGLQHLRLERDVQIVVLDAARMFGNGLCLPAGPLREGRRRLKKADAVVITGGAERDGHFASRLMPAAPRPVNPRSVRQLAPGSPVCAVAGIGNPSRFYATVESMGFLVVKSLYVPDHGRVAIDRLEAEARTLPLVMTAKDAVKYDYLAPENAFVIDIRAQLSAAFFDLLHDRVEKASQRLKARQLREQIRASA